MTSRISSAKPSDQRSRPCQSRRHRQPCIQRSSRSWPHRHYPGRARVSRLCPSFHWPLYTEQGSVRKLNLTQLQRINPERDSIQQQSIAGGDWPCQVHCVLQGLGVCMRPQLQRRGTRRRRFSSSWSSYTRDKPCSTGYMLMCPRSMLTKETREQEVMK